MYEDAVMDGAVSPAITYKRRLDRSIDELVGISMGILADGVIVTQEAQFLLSWIERHRDFINQYPYSILYPRLSAMLADGVLDPEEEGELMGMLLALQGGIEEGPSTLPLCNPLPDVLFEGRSFVVTGTFSFGSRTKVVAEITARGGDVRQAPTRKTDYLVIGDVGSRDWKHSSFGNKIETAINLRESGTGISIVSEEHWLNFL